MHPSKVSVNGEDLSGFVKAILQANSPTDAYGCPQANTPRPFVATLFRDLDGPPGTKGFEWATGGDGSLVELSVEIELQNGARKTTHYITLRDAYLSSISTRDEGSGTREQWVIHAGQVDFTASGEVERYDPNLQLVPGMGI